MELSIVRGFPFAAEHACHAVSAKLMYNACEFQHQSGAVIGEWHDSSTLV